MLAQCGSEILLLMLLLLGESFLACLSSIDIGRELSAWQLEHKAWQT